MNLSRTNRFPFRRAFAGLAALAVLAVVGAAGPTSVHSQERPSPPSLTTKTIDQWMKELSNWSRWGADDELGTLNLITPEKRRQAAALVKDGISVSLALDVSKEMTDNNPYPLEHELHMIGIDYPEQFAGDTYKIRYHGYAHSHVDGLCHMFHQERMYNGFSKESVKPTGSEKLGIHNFKNGIFTRGVLVDVPLLKGIPYLEPGTPIFPQDLDAWEKRAGLRVGSGDVLLIRTGRWARQQKEGPWDFTEKAAGLHASAAKWLKERDVAVIGCDGVSDVVPSGVEGLSTPIHQLVLIAMGMPILDNLDLEALAKEAAARERWEFLITAAPLPIPGGTGSPLNPIATF